MPPPRWGAALWGAGVLACVCMVAYNSRLARTAVVGKNQGHVVTAKDGIDPAEDDFSLKVSPFYDWIGCMDNNANKTQVRLTVKGKLIEVDWHKARTCLRNRSIVFLGDSLVRYQYINLAYYLSYGVWESVERPHNENERTFKSWNAFFFETNRRLNSERTLEICDCYRTGYYEAKTSGTTEYLENRYWKSDEDTRLAFFQVFGANISMQMHDLDFLNVTCPTFPCRQGGCLAGRCKPSSRKYASHLTVFPNLEAGLASSAASVRPVDTIVFNQGYWLDFAGNLSHYSNLLKRFEGKLQSLGMRPRFVWKSTTPLWSHSNLDQLARERKLVEMAGGSWEMFDTTTAPMVLMQKSKQALASDWLPSNSSWSVFFDHIHFHTFVNRALNELFLVQIIPSSCKFFEWKDPPPCSSHLTQARWAPTD